jgi:hypothetical protein
MPFGRPTPSWADGRPGVDHPEGEFDVFSYYQLVILFLNMVCLTMALAISFQSLCPRISMLAVLQWTLPLHALTIVRSKGFRSKILRFGH